MSEHDVQIPLVLIPHTSHFDKETEENIRNIFVTGCSCAESTKKMWIELEQTSTNSLLNCDVPDHPQTTTDLIMTCVTSLSPENVSSQDFQKESEILKTYWSQLVQKVHNGDNTSTVLLCRAINKKPLILGPFLQMLSDCISFAPPSKPKEGLCDETTIHMDMKYLLEGKQEAKILDHLVKQIEDMEVKSKILAHPLINTFAELKYQKYRPLSVFLLIYHLLFANLFTNYAFNEFLTQHPASIVTITKLSIIALTLMAALSSLKIITGFFASGIKFDLTTTRRFGETFCVFVAFFMCLLPSIGYTFFSRTLNKDITAFGVMTSWLVVLSYLTKFNQTAAYVQTFFEIVKNYFHFLWMVALCQFIALSASYSLIFNKSEQGLPGNFSRSVIRVLTGRMNYDDYTAEKANLENPISVFNYFFFYFVLSTVMMAMIIGLAQNGLVSIRSASAVNVLCQVIKDIAELEWILGRLQPILPSKLNIWLFSKISIKDVLVSLESTILVIRPHYYESKGKIPKTLKKSIFKQLVDRGSKCPQNRHTFKAFQKC